MEPVEVKETLEGAPASAPKDAPASAVRADSVIAAQSCPTCGTAPSANGMAAIPAFIYAIGKIEPRFPRPSVEKEFAQATGRAETAGLTDRQAVQKVLS
ncbi:MAG TPA: hypothetical protein VFJ52_12560, partial [Terriglobia bacterium]|nr:hypothetical protein [Terriglobia bacterium]